MPDRQTEKLKLIELLYQALDAEVGLIVRSNNVTLLRQRLYAARQDDENLKVLTLSPSPIDPNAELWIHKDDQG